MAHRDAIINGNGIEFLGNTASGLNLTRDHLTEVFEVHVTGHKLCETVDDRDDWLVEIFVFHTSGAPKAARTSHIAAMCCCTGPIFRHGRNLSYSRIAFS